MKSRSNWQRFIFWRAEFSAQGLGFWRGHRGVSGRVESERKTYFSVTLDVITECLEARPHECGLIHAGPLGDGFDAIF